MSVGVVNDAQKVAENKVRVVSLIQKVYEIVSYIFRNLVIDYVSANINLIFHRNRGIIKNKV